MRKYLVVLIVSLLYSCSNKENNIEERCFAVININDREITLEIKSVNYKSAFTVESLKDELKKGLDYYYKLKPEVWNQYLIRYDDSIDPHFLKEIRSILSEFKNKNIDKGNISMTLFGKSYYDTYPGEREIIEKHYPGIIFSIRK